MSVHTKEHYFNTDKSATDLFFDLEQEILRMWGVKDDIELLVEKYIDSPQPLSEDEVSNYLMALARITDLRCSKAFSIFEDYAEKRWEEKKEVVNGHANELLEMAATIVESEGLEPAMSVPPEPLRARLARQIRKLKSSEYSRATEWDEEINN
jgi:hypothetical protein